MLTSFLRDRKDLQETTHPTVHKKLKHKLVTLIASFVLLQVDPGLACTCQHLLPPNAAFKACHPKKFLKGEETANTMLPHRGVKYSKSFSLVQRRPQSLDRQKKTARKFSCCNNFSNIYPMWFISDVMQMLIWQDVQNSGLCTQRLTFSFFP